MIYGGWYHRCRATGVSQEAAGVGSGLRRTEAHEDPAGGPVNGHEEVAAALLVGNLRQVFHVDMHMAGLAGLEGPMRGPRCSGRQRAQVGHAMPPQAAVKPGARDMRVEELPHHGEQIVERQQQGPAQSDRVRLPRAGANVVCNRCGVWLRSWTPSRLRHFRTVCSLTPQRSATIHAGSALAWIAAPTFGVVVACLCKETSMLEPVPNLAQDRSCQEQGSATRVYVTIRD